MSTPRIEIDLDAIKHNTLKILSWFKPCGIQILAVTKLIHGCPRILKIIKDNGLDHFADSRIENINRIHLHYPHIDFGFIRIPNPWEAPEVITHCAWSTHSQQETLEAFENEAKVRTRKHGIMLMVEMGDLREGVMPDLLPKLLELVLQSDWLYLRGLSVNLACFGGIQHDQQFLNRFIELKCGIERKFNFTFPVVSYGNSAVLRHLESISKSPINEIRLGEAIFLGTEPGSSTPIRDLVNDAFQIIGTVLECSIKPEKPYGGMQGLNAFGEILNVSTAFPYHVLVDLGRLDTKPDQLTNADLKILGGSSDYLVLRSKSKLTVGTEVKFQGSYEAILRAMHSPFVDKVYKKL